MLLCAGKSPAPGGVLLLSTSATSTAATTIETTQLQLLVFSTPRSPKPALFTSLIACFHEEGLRKVT